MGEKQEINKSLNVLASSAVIVLVGVVLSKIFTYIYRVIIARQFGPEVYGSFSLAINILSLIIAISLLGFDSGLVRFIPLYKSQNKEKNIPLLIKFSSKTVLLVSSILGALLFIFSNSISINLFHEPTLSIYLKLFSLLVPISALGSYFLAIIIANEKIKLYSFIENIATNGLNVVCLVILLFFSFKSFSVPLSYFLGTTILLFLTLYLYNKHIHYPKSSKYSKSDYSQVKKDFLSYSIPLLFFTMFTFIMSWVDSFSLGYFKSTREVGLYNAAVPIAMLMNLAPQLFIKLFFPIITREYGKKRNYTISELSKQVNKWIFFINLPLFAMIFIFPERFISLFFGSEYLSASTSLQILVVGSLLLSLSKISDRIIAMLGKSKILLTNIMISILINFTLNAVFIPMPEVFGIENSLGINGAAIATVISSLVLVFLSLIQTKNYSSIMPIRRKMLNLIIAIVLSTLIILKLKNFIIDGLSLVIFSIFFLLIYLIFSWFLKSFDTNDLNAIKLIKPNFSK